MNNAITESKSTLEGSISRITEAEDRISEVEDRMVEINETEEKRRIKRNEDNLRDLWDNVKHPNIQIIGVPEEDKKKGHEKIHILIKLMKIKHKVQILNAAREKQQITHKGIPIRITAYLSIETLQAKENVRTYLK